MSTLTEIWSMLTGAQRRAVLTMVLVSMVMALSTAIGIAAIAPFFAVLGNPQLIEHQPALHWLYAHGRFSDTRGFMLALGVGFIAAVVIADLINILGLYAMNRLMLRIGNELQTTLFAEYLAWPYAAHLATNSVALLNNVVYEAMRVTLGVMQHSFTLVTNAVTGALLIVSLLLLKPVLAVAMIGALGGGYVLSYAFVHQRLLRIGENQSRFAVEQAQIVTEALGGIKEIIIRRAQAFFRHRFERANYGFLSATMQSQIIAQAPRYVLECVAAAGLVGGALILTDRGSSVSAQLGLLTFLAFATYRLLPTMQQIFASIARIRADRAALSQIGAHLKRARVMGQAATSARAVPIDRTWFPSPKHDIQLHDVWYRYGSDRPWALQGVSLQIPACTMVGIVGASGSGKSTILNLITGLLTPCSGELRIDGCALNDDRCVDWQARLAYVPETIFLLDCSIAENIALGVTASDIDRARLLRATRMAQLDEFIATLPDRYEQRVGERGLALSAGQRQRIGIARALYRDAAVLLLDEATNALDTLTEQALMTTLEDLRGHYTIILVAHRLSTLSTCDVLIQLELGRIVASGTLDGLLRSSPALRHMAGAH